MRHTVLHHERHKTTRRTRSVVAVFLNQIFLCGKFHLFFLRFMMAWSPFALWRRLVVLLPERWRLRAERRERPLLRVSLDSILSVGGSAWLEVQRDEVDRYDKQRGSGLIVEPIGGLKWVVNYTGIFMGSKCADYAELKPLNVGLRRENYVFKCGIFHWWKNDKQQLHDHFENMVGNFSSFLFVVMKMFIFFSLACDPVHPTVQRQKTKQKNKTKKQ